MNATHGYASLDVASTRLPSTSEVPGDTRHGIWGVDMGWNPNTRQFLILMEPITWTADGWWRPVGGKIPTSSARAPSLPAIVVTDPETATFFHSPDGTAWRQLGDEIYFGSSGHHLRDGRRGDPDLGWVGRYMEGQQNALCRQVTQVNAAAPPPSTPRNTTSPMTHDRTQPLLSAPSDAIAARATTLSVAGRSASVVLAAVLMAFTTLSSGAPAHETSGARPKVIVMTDGEIDDHSSMIRFLLYASDVEVKAIIETNSMFQRNGHSEKSWYEDQLAAYEAVYPNLIKHRPGYPTAAELRARSFVGDEDYEHLKGTRETRWEQIPGGPVEFDPAGWPDTPGSDAIVRILLEKDPAPIHLQAWGGGNTASRAFYKLKRDHPADYERALSKVVMYNIWYQDDAGNYIETHHPLVTMIYCGHFAGTWNYRSQPATHDFITHHVKKNHGPLGALYPQTYVSEGDSPAFFYVVDNGLRNHEHPGFGGWGGRFKKVDGFERVYIDAEDKGGKKYQLARWIDAVNRDFQARMDWCVAENFADANHAPVARVAGGLVRTAKPGETVRLDARGTTDPDGNKLAFKWWQYHEAGTAETTVIIANADSPTSSFVAPDEPGKQLHLILEVTDDGAPSLVGYQRVIVTIDR